MSPLLLSCDIPDFGQPDSFHRMAYTVWGEATAGRTALCVHGLTRNGRDFDFLAAELASKGFRVICPDMPGRGKSQWLADPKGYSYPAYVADILALLSCEHITQVDWIGTSMGGIIGMMAANMAPGLIRSLVLNDIGCVVSAVGLKRIMAYAGQVTRYATQVEAEAVMRERCAPFGIESEAHWQQLFAHSFQQNNDGSFSFACDPAISAGLPAIDAVTDIDLWAMWEGISKIPLLLIRGEESDILTHATAKDMQSRHPDLALHEIPHAGHAPALMDDYAIALIRDWLSE